MTDLDPARTALVLIDLMDRIVDMPLAPRSGKDVLETACRLAEEFRAAGAPVVAVRVERPGVAEQPPGSRLAERVAALADAVVVKRAVGGFHGTSLDDVLRGYGADTLVFAGIATNMGVESTARSASDLGFELVFVEDAMTAFTTAEHDAAIALNLPRFGEVVHSAGVRVDAGAARA
ncbi:isochorismatase family protein [Streptomyces sp. SID3343]|uniref:isochorismatase family protein n=1 Tax=Streptomyces sp. SID3343 TaxID=2690260 RepID=UPI001369B32D|nr:isochorismatase family protein [Streptomyces sp. SID3343]MYV98307.1 isochorismatase family protein [Streptomyces sp. SID3343]